MISITSMTHCDSRVANDRLILFFFILRALKPIFFCKGIILYRILQTLRQFSFYTGKGTQILALLQQESSVWFVLRKNTNVKKMDSAKTTCTMQ
jgi:hypothetical protein